jgi:hypothetical protein
MQVPMQGFVQQGVPVPNQAPMQAPPQQFVQQGMPVPMQVPMQAPRQQIAKNTPPKRELAHQFMQGFGKGVMLGPDRRGIPFEFTFGTLLADKALGITSRPGENRTQVDQHPVKRSGRSVLDDPVKNWPRTVFDHEFVYNLSSVNYSPNPDDTSGYYKCWKCNARIHLDARGKVRLPTHGKRTPIPLHKDPEGECSNAAWLRQSTYSGFLTECRTYVEEHCTESIHALSEEIGNKIQTARKLIGLQNIVITKKTLQRWRAQALNASQRDEKINWRSLEKFGPSKITWLRSVELIPKKFVWWMTDKGKNCLQNATVWLVDGTFRSCPNSYYQLLTFMAVVFQGNEEYYIPCAHMLCEEKDRSFYESVLSKMFQALKPANNSGDSLWLGLRRIIIDFDEAEKGGFEDAIKRFGLEVQIGGCLFHYGQALWRFFHRTYGKKTSALAKMLLQAYFWLPYFKKEDVQNIINRIGEKSTCSEFFTYFNNWWMRRLDWWWVGPNAPCSITTNSAIESFHGKLNKEIPCPHPSVMDINDILFKMDTSQLLREENGQPGPEAKGICPRKLELFRRHSEYITGVINRLIDALPNKETEPQSGDTGVVKPSEKPAKGKLSSTRVMQEGEAAQNVAEEITECIDDNVQISDLMCADLFALNEGGQTEFSETKVSDYFLGKQLSE